MSPEAHAALALRFARAIQELGATQVPDQGFQALLAAYAEPQRHYHTLEHVEACLAWLDWTWASAERPHEVQLALFYHDAVYEPLSPDNEARSAELMRRDLIPAGAPQGAVERIAQMILATREHSAGAGDAALLMDIDLAILGAPEPVFERFERDVRAEYAAVPQPLYAQGRAAALRKLAARAPLYRNELLASELSDRAKLNLARAIARWAHG